MTLTQIGPFEDTQLGRPEMHKQQPPNPSPMYEPGLSASHAVFTLGPFYLPGVDIVGGSNPPCSL